MTTQPLRTPIALLLALSFGACATHSTPNGVRPATPLPRLSLFIDNESRQRIDVYLIEDTRERYLGRVESGARTWLRLPELSPPGQSSVRLAVLADAARSLRPSRDAHAVVTIGQPMAALVEQEWVFVDNQLTGLRTRDEHTPRERGRSR